MNQPLVRDRMTSPAVTERPDISVTALTAILRLRAISAVPIVKDGDLLGIVSTTDILRSPHIARAQDIMTSPVVTANVDEPLDVAARRLVDARVHRVIAVENGRVAGVLSARDILVEVKNRKVTDPLSSLMRMPVETIEIGDPIEDAVLRLANANIHGLVVTDGSAPVGVFTHAEALAARKLPPELLRGPVEEVMSYETICLDAATSIHRAAAYSVAMNVRRILVVERKYLAGILSCVDLVGVLARMPAEDAAVVPATSSVLAASGAP
jgi:predicted transcriptional regulator